LAKSVWYFVTFVFLFILAAGLIGTPPARGQDACDPALYHYTDTFTEPDGPAAGWTPVSGTWGVENGEYSGSIGPGLMANTFITGTDDLSDYKVEVSVFPIGPADELGWRAGLLVRAKGHPGSNGYDGYLIFTYWHGLRIHKLVNDVVVGAIYEGFGHIPANTWHTLGVEAKGNHLKFYFNGQVVTPFPWILQTIDGAVIDDSLGGSPFSSGMIGLRVWGNSGPPHVHFDNFKYCGQTISNAVLAINCGGPQYMHPNGILFQADTLFTGGSAYTTTASIEGVEDFEYGVPYQSERYGNFSYKIPLPNGDYNVILGFAEIYPYISRGTREFDVIIQGKRVLMDFDLFAWVGKNKAFEVPVYVNVTDGVLEIKFSSERGNAKVNFIVITPPQGLRQQDVVFAVNCGGPEYTDKTGIVYQEDTRFSGGRTYTTAAMIEGTEDDLLYQSERYGNFSYNIPVENGDYRVTLRFAELYSYAYVGARVFDVAIEGKKVVSNLDLFALKGKNNSYDYTIPFPISITDGVLNIDFYNHDGTAKVNAILVTRNKE
jgi:hypothetical protein